MLRCSKPTTPYMATPHEKRPQRAANLVLTCAGDPQSGRTKHIAHNAALPRAY